MTATTEADDEAFLAKLRERLAHASRGDRMYERPMSWEEADRLLALAALPHLVAAVPDAAVEAAVLAEREAIVEQARLYASYYPPHSDGRNTFVILADWILTRSAASLPPKGSEI